MENQEKNNESPRQDEDVQFERDKESLILPLTEEKEITAQPPTDDSPLPAKEDTLGKSDFPALSEKDKQPKLQDDTERIQEMNRRSSMD